MQRHVPSIPAAARSRSKGIALVSVLWLVILLGVLALGLLSILQDDSRTARIFADDVQAEGLADAGVFLAIHELSNVDTAKDVPVDGHVRNVRIDGHEIEVSVQDENGKIDVNFAPPETLRSLIILAGKPEPEANQVTEAIGQRKRMLNNPSANTSPVAGRLPFLTVEQIQSASGISRDLFERIRPSLTVYSQQPTVQPATAPERVLRTLPGMSGDKVDEVMAGRRDHPVTAARIGMIEAMANQNSPFGRAFTILSKAKVDEAVFIRRAVVFITGNPQKPFRIMDWSSDSAEASDLQ